MKTDPAVAEARVVRELLVARLGIRLHDIVQEAR